MGGQIWSSKRLEDSLELDERLLPKLGPRRKVICDLTSTFIKLANSIGREPTITGALLDALLVCRSTSAIPLKSRSNRLWRNWGVRIFKSVSNFDPAPLAALRWPGPLAHMRDGRAVVFKVQRPDIREQIVDDLETLNEIARFWMATEWSALRV